MKTGCQISMRKTQHLTPGMNPPQSLPLLSSYPSELA